MTPGQLQQLISGSRCQCLFLCRVERGLTDAAMLDITMGAPPRAITRPNSSNARAVPKRSTFRITPGGAMQATRRRLGQPE
jgi:hypothetical protein